MNTVIGGSATTRAVDANTGCNPYTSVLKHEADKERPMPHAMLILMLSAIWPLLALAADPAPAQADFEPKPLRSAEMQTPPDTAPLRGPEDFAMPAPELAPRTDGYPAAQEPISDPKLPSNPSVLEGF